VSGASGLGGFDSSFVDEHDGNVVFYGVYTMALLALQALGILAVVERLLAGGADQNVEERLGEHEGYFTRDRVGVRWR
jgi:ABC-type proline/glycine betaine transport system permease subunit